MGPGFRRGSEGWASGRESRERGNGKRRAALALCRRKEAAMFFDGWDDLVRLVVIGVLAYAGLVAILRLSLIHI